MTRQRIPNRKQGRPGRQSFAMSLGARDPRWGRNMQNEVVDIDSAPPVPDSTAETIAELRADLNRLKASLRKAGILKE